MVFPFEALGINFIDIFCAGWAGSKPTIGGTDLQSSDTGVIGRRFGQFRCNQITGKGSRTHLFRRQFGENRFLRA